jgi:hypothetical protein
MGPVGKAAGKARTRTEGTTVEHEVREDRHHPGDWRVEAIDHRSEGECHVTIFTGADAEGRAREYAARKAAETPR